MFVTLYEHAAFLKNLCFSNYQIEFGTFSARFLNNFSFSFPLTLLYTVSFTQWARDSLKVHRVKHEDACVTCGASNLPTSPISNPVHPCLVCKPRWSVRCLSCLSDQISKPSRGQPRLRAHQKRIRNGTPVPTGAVALMEFREESGCFESADEE